MNCNNLYKKKKKMKNCTNLRWQHKIILQLLLVVKHLYSNYLIALSIFIFVQKKIQILSNMNEPVVVVKFETQEI